MSVDFVMFWYKEGEMSVDFVMFWYRIIRKVKFVVIKIGEKD